MFLKLFLLPILICNLSWPQSWMSIPRKCDRLCSGTGCHYLCVWCHEWSYWWYCSRLVIVDGAPCEPFNTSIRIFGNYIRRVLTRNPSDTFTVSSCVTRAVPLLSDVTRAWRGPSPVSLPHGPREAILNHASKQMAGQATRSHSNRCEFPPAPPREPLKLKPCSVPSQESHRNGLETLETKVEDEAAVQLNTRFDALFTGGE
jgi:pyruvate-formate lyase-activating enzyme